MVECKHHVVERLVLEVVDWGIIDSNVVMFLFGGDGHSPCDDHTNSANHVACVQPYITSLCEVLLK